MAHSRKREYCEILGVTAEADEETVKRAYRRLAMEYHPDRPNNKGKEQEAAIMFNKINEAYEGLQTNNNTLNMLKASFKSQEIHSSLEHFFFTTGKNVSFTFSSVFNSKEFIPMSTNPSQTQQPSTNATTPTTTPIPSSTSAASASTPKKLPRDGQSLQTTLKIGFQESLSGCQKTIEYNLTKDCTACEGGSVRSKTGCKDCEGKGFLFKEGSSGNILQIACISCHSRASSTTCSSCNGTGKTAVKQTTTIAVPAGVFSGMKKVYEKQGEEGQAGGKHGDLIIYFEVEPHPFYLRPNASGDDVFCRATVPFPFAALGTVMEIPSMYGKKLQISLEPGTPHDHIIKVKDEGFWNITKQKRGDMYIQISIEIPKGLDEKEKKLLRKLAKKANFKPLFPCGNM